MPVEDDFNSKLFMQLQLFEYFISLLTLLHTDFAKHNHVLK